MLAEARALVSERLGLAFPSRRGDDLQQAFAERSLATLREQPTTAPEWRSLISELTVRESYFFRESAELERALAGLIAERQDAAPAGALERGLRVRRGAVHAGDAARLDGRRVGHHDPGHRRRRRGAGGRTARQLQRVGAARHARLGARAALPPRRPEALRAFAPDPRGGDVCALEPRHRRISRVARLDRLPQRPHVLHGCRARAHRRAARRRSGPGRAARAQPARRAAAGGGAAAGAGRAVAAAGAARRASTRSPAPAPRPTAAGSRPRVRCAWRRCASARWTSTPTCCWPPSRRSAGISTPRSGHCGGRSTPRPTARRRISGSVACCCARARPTPAGAASPPPPRCSRPRRADSLVDGLTAGEVLAAAKAAS